jgi:hypothetical protein
MPCLVWAAGLLNNGAQENRTCCAITADGWHGIFITDRYRTFILDIEKVRRQRQTPNFKFYLKKTQHDKTRTHNNRRR